MKYSLLIAMAIICFIAQPIHAQKVKTDANIIGHVVSKGKHIPFATISIQGSTIGTTTNESGHYQLIHLPEGTHILVAQSMGFKPATKEVTVQAKKTIEIHFNLLEDALGLEEVLITGDRNATNRIESSTIVTALTPKLFATGNALTLSEGLNFCSGLRIENDCQNCGFSQVRMNGMEGSYSQILINSRPIFSGLAGVYGLELIPSSMIERVEVIRGGGSALYGSNAIAGTINLILKDPINNSYEFGINQGIIGFETENAEGVARDLSVNMNTSLISADNKTGMAIYGFYRDRQPFDANQDSYSEIALLKNTTIGTRLFHRFGAKNKLIADFFHIKEDRRGGDRFDYPVHEANIAEALNHQISTGALTYEQFVRKNDLLSIFVSGQKVERDSYYGANKSLSDYGKTNDFTYTLGAQYNAQFSISSLVLGIENNASELKDQKLGFADFDQAVIVNDSLVSIPHTDNVMVANQRTQTTGVFAQYEYNLERFKLSAGARFDHYTVTDFEGGDHTGNVLSPRLSAKIDIFKSLQGRLSYSQGYRSPQIYDEDLHIETSGSRKVIHVNSPDLEQESSRSFTASLDFNKQFNTLGFGFLAEAFYTQLDNPFANLYSLPDENGTVIYTRINAKDGANVQGLNFELNLIPTKNISIKAGFTVQKSRYDIEQDFKEKRFFRTPQDYGFLTFDWELNKQWGISSTANYTGAMLVPYFGPQIPNPEAGVLITSGRFLDMGLKIKYGIKLNGATLQLFAGVKNLFNSYQNDFDNGINRDPGFVYGPVNPRTIYFGLKVGNFLN